MFALRGLIEGTKKGGGKLLPEDLLAVGQLQH